MSITSAAAAAPPYRDRKRYAWLLSALVPAFIGSGALLVLWTGDARLAWLPVAFLYLVVPVLDLLLGEDRSNPPESRGAGAGGRPLLPLGDLRPGADAVAGLHRERLVPGHARAALARAAGAGAVGRAGRRLRHQPGPRTGPQEHPAGTLAGQDHPRAHRLRPLLHRAQPRPPPRRGHAGRPGQLAHGRDDLRLRAARDARCLEARLADRGRAPGPLRPAGLVAAQRGAAAAADDAGAVGGAGGLAGHRRAAVPAGHRRSGPTSSSPRPTTSSTTACCASSARRAATRSASRAIRGTATTCSRTGSSSTCSAIPTTMRTRCGATSRCATSTTCRSCPTATSACSWCATCRRCGSA